MSLAATETRNRAAGFTLVELLVALTLMGIVVVLVYDGLRLGGRSAEALAGDVDATEQVRLAHALLRRQLEQARPEVDDDGPGRPHSEQAPPLSGGPEALSFIAPLPGRIGAGGLYRFHVHAAEDGERRRLQISYARHQPGDWERFGDAEPRRLVLLEDVEALSFEYFGSPDEQREPDWSRTWQAPDRLPRLVRLRIRPGPGLGDAQFPELIVAPRVRESSS